ncbi:hypothetical protein FIV42_16660 [Persicimonas caeni]|uniref:malate synthase n=1 Tax=Persicimonas caeni TaxID=2292766 RepID=A0A4Y6PW15_PERCE|nr:hypothetical protein [Persicimonas caeni]QDG52309.1 hypothetical protein FIV42_16660 [Persicimonas caeni]QED33531.1 hypothetical protein FRD00_16655 [Persicimonas caeni]
MTTSKRDIPYYRDFLPDELLARLVREGEPAQGVPGLTVAPGLRDAFGHIETDEALAFVCELYRRTRDHLRRVLDRRQEDRAFVDEVVAESVERNATREYLSPDYETPIGRRDQAGRVVVGPLPDDERAEPAPVEVPEFIEGIQVTLFGPPDTAKMSINAMNALHRRLPDEPALVAELVEASGAVPRWGADNEDSKTPIMRNFLHACDNLLGCFDGTLRFEDTRRTDQAGRAKTYELADDKLAKPIKRIPGLALPDGNHLLDGQPLPLHLVDFALHLFHNWQRPEALVFYVPKLENEEEAAYLAALIAEAEAMIHVQHPEYEPGSVRLFIVFENPRAIFRIREIAQALSPHFLGGSLGWHDFLASTARLFRNDPRYRIPVKADPNIVINHIKESHEILAKALAPMGAISIGGMYGVLYEGGNRDSFEVCMVGYIKDVVTQLKRGLDGFWVAHPDFVRPGIALVEAFRRWREDPRDDVLERLVEALVPDPVEREPLVEFIFGDDVPGLAEDDPLYLRGVLAANVETSDVIQNDDPEEVRYNVFQALQYLADWLAGNGCVALPATMENARGEQIFVRIMDDLATTERSRWELWAEIAHGRVSLELFDDILFEELEFIRDGRQTPTKRVQVAWEGEAARWYPIAARLLRQLVTSDEPPEFATELLMPFTLDCVREAEDAWQAAVALCPGKYI